MSRKNRDVLVLSLVGVTILIAGTVFAYWRLQQHAAPVTASSERKVLYWHDPMVPTARFDQPGKSPFMDMQLVPVYADEAGQEGGVRVASSVSQSLGVRLGKVERLPFEAQLTAVGSVAFDDRQLAVVSARVEGVVLQLHVRTPLEAVSRGQPLATLQVPAWIGAQQEYLALLDARSDSGRMLRAAARERLGVLGVPAAVVARIDSARQVEATTTITAPIDGVVTELGVREGTAFMAGAPLFRINGLGSVWVNVRVPEAQVSRVQPGAVANASATAWPGEVFAGKVIALLPEVDAATRTMTARVALDNRDRRLSPGMFVSVSFTGAAARQVLVVPDEALIVTGTRTVVVTSLPDGAFGVAHVRVGAQQDGHTEVLEGLMEGQSVVLSGQFLIDSEASLKAALTRLETQSDANPVHHAEGSITQIEGKSITLDHAAVPSMQWPAMAMTFESPAQGMPSGLKPGDRVMFSFVATAAGYRIETITRAAAK